MKVHFAKHTFYAGTPTKNPRKSTSQTSNYIKNTNTLSDYPANVSFGRVLGYHDFLKEMRQIYKTKSLKNVVLSTIADKKNYIGRGFCANAYDVPGIPDYIIRVERDKFTPQSFIQNPIIEEVQNSLAPNFGQFVASNNHGFFINKKVIGKSHSLNDWAERIKEIENGAELNHTEAKIILDKIVKIADYPYRSFVELSQKIRKLNKYTESEIDIINPNNLIVNEENKSFGIIDLWYKHKDNGCFGAYNGADSIINLMLDPFTHKRAYERLSIADGEKLQKASETIIKKVLKAADETGLQRTNDYAMSIYKDMDKKLPQNFAQDSYLTFLDMYKNIL